ncbi:UDP-2,3-diacylglucosamine diphosphatase [Piscirickettsia salmonis]|uniref:UDP-2,3-diacylglucosamine diphosphatase n=1 Tax=Piscirickettsia salmonis TaxID=1238 RepID=UPI0007C888D3|nr:UDP-2,3-diacylglucosamine hydrolase [Piscirickettsiaceae bacterium NZ-RLO1]
MTTPDYQALFISDLHLSPEHPKLITLFLDYLSKTAIHSQALYILGDFFEFWIGNDDPEPLYQEIQQALQQASQTTNIYFMPGNRDFLLGSTWCQTAGMTLLADPSVITINNQTILLSHGDLYCTGDTSYQRYRYWVRKPWLQRCFLSLPLTWRLKIASNIHQAGRQKQKTYLKPIDIHEETIKHYSQKYQSNRLIHGHTHRLGWHNHSHCQRWVLGDWRDKATDLCIFHSGKWQLRDHQPT